MKKRVVLLICAVCLCFVPGCGTTGNNEKLPDDFGADTSLYLSEDDFDVMEHRELIDKFFGETWHSDNYNKDEIVRPKVKAEETAEGENWFPPINNTAPIDEIAPTISYELMCDGYMKSPYYPQNPEDYTAQALNDNAFPINFFRKVNDLCYYTVCKVEGGGYIYYFFCANGNVDYEKAMEAAGMEPNHDSEGNLLIEENVHLFNADLADLSNTDITKEAVWRGSVYAEADTGSIADFEKIMSDMDYSMEDIEGHTLKDLSEIFASVKPLLKTEKRYIKNISDDTDDGYRVFQDINQNGNFFRVINMCSDGYRFISFSGAVDTQSENDDYYDTLICNGYGSPGTQNPCFFCIYGTHGARDAISEYNSFSIDILPQDNVYAMVKS